MDNSVHKCVETIAHATFSPNIGWTSVLAYEREQTNAPHTATVRSLSISGLGSIHWLILERLTQPPVNR